MIERPEAGQSPDDKDPFKAQAPQPGHFLQSEDEDTDVASGDVKDESDGMEKTDFLGKTNLENRDEK